VVVQLFLVMMAVASAKEPLIAGRAAIRVLKHHKVAEPIFDAASFRTKELFATAIWATGGLSVRSGFVHGKVLCWGRLSYNAWRSRGQRLPSLVLSFVMDTISRTSVHKRTPMRFLVDGLQVWASYLDGNNNGPFGVRFLWTEDALDCGPQKHITDDGGYTYRKYDSYLMPGDGTTDMRTVALETDPDKLNRLQRIWVVYQQRLDETVFSV
jgi:hypothetical protein